ncbi:hypothetical protein B0H19DRAFT_1072060 [Mycena capillaripes]|nr:hypothetical protein B0H19DRAFT_1072060 [Mycena capillaripes]
MPNTMDTTIPAPDLTRAAPFFVPLVAAGSELDVEDGSESFELVLSPLDLFESSVGVGLAMVNEVNPEVKLPVAGEPGEIEPGESGEPVEPEELELPDTETDPPSPMLIWIEKPRVAQRCTKSAGQSEQVGTNIPDGRVSHRRQCLGYPE